MINVAELCKRYIMQRFNVPNTINMNDPQGIVQYLLNSGARSQTDLNQAIQTYSDPSVKQYFGIR